MRLLDIFPLGPSHRSSSCMKGSVKKIYLGNVDLREVPSCICAVEIAHFLHNWLQVCYRDITGRSSIIACDCTSSTIFPWLHSLVFVRWLHLYLCVGQIIFVLDSLKLMGGASISQPAFDFLAGIHWVARIILLCYLPEARGVQKFTLVECAAETNDWLNS